MKYVKAYHVDAKDGRPANEYPMRHGPSWPSDALTASIVDRREYPAMIVGTLPNESPLPAGATEITQAEHAELVKSFNDWRNAFEQEQLELRAAQERKRRDTLLDESDFAVLPDSPVADVEPWKTYRQALRDVPQQAGFPNDIEWPEKP
jgi:hypothetical protein